MRERERVRYRARWVVPIACPPLADGWVDVEGERIVAVGGGPPRAPAGPAPPVRELDLGDAALVPGLVNAHTHLELSYLRGRVSPAPTMPAWVEELLRQRVLAGPPTVGAVRQALVEARASGTILLGDITNTLTTVGPLAESPLFARVFYELLGLRVRDPAVSVEEAVARLRALGWTARVRPALAAHAPYSVAPSLFRAIAAAARAFDGGPSSVHLAESREELEFLAHGTGAWRTLLEALGAWDAAWQPPDESPVAYLDHLGWFGTPTLVVHGVHLADGDLSDLAARHAVLVTCPRSNAWTGAGTPPIERFYRAGVRVAVGTDSLASVEDLNVFAELAALRRLAPSVPARRLLESATLVGAEALGFGDELGSLTSGKRAALLAVRVPGNVTDVEEYLVSGIAPSQIAWVSGG